MNQPERILLIRPSSLGDVCRSVPVAASLRAAYPSARIDWLVSEGYEDAVRTHPGVSGVVTFPRRRLGRELKTGRIWTVAGWLGTLRAANYDVCIDAQGLLRSGLMALATGAPTRVGHADARELAWMCYTHRRENTGITHTVDRMLDLVRALGIEAIADMRLHPPPEEREAAARDRELREPYAVFAPTSRWAGKQWPEDRFAELMRRLLDTGRVGRVVLVGAASEREQIPRLLALAEADRRVLDLTGRTTLGQLMAVVERAELLVGNDSAAVHIATGLARPLVAIYGPTRVERVGPYGRAGDVLQRVSAGDRLDHKRTGAGLELMRRVSVEDAEGACVERLSRCGAQTPA